MPKVDGKHYEYSPKGIAMAKNAAKKKDVKVQYKMHGGEVVSGNANRRRNQLQSN
jgi:aspartyl aminopeptidase|tara:strand:+ start:451 stop:615 length:165 start_codon:yes stop_codon:yes gene_type:complete